MVVFKYTNLICYCQYFGEKPALSDSSYEYNLQKN